MFIEKYTNGKIKSVRLNTDKRVSFILPNGDSRTFNDCDSEEKFVSFMKEIDNEIDTDFIKKLYQILNGRKI